LLFHFLALLELSLKFLLETLKKENSLKLYVGNLSHCVTEAELTKLFSCYGAVKDAHIVKDHHTRQSKNFAYITMPCAKEGRNALAGMDGHTINKRPMVVKEARSRDERLGLAW